MAQIVEASARATDFLQLRVRLHELGLTGNPGSYINPGYKNKYFHMDPVSQGFRPQVFQGYCPP